MKVKYPYCRRCGKSRIKKEEQIYKNIGEDKANGGVTTHERTYCAMCGGPLAWKAKTYGKKSVGDVCPECKGYKSWYARSCRMCHAKYTRENPSLKFGDNNDEFRNKIEKSDELSISGSNF